MTYSLRTSARIATLALVLAALCVAAGCGGCGEDADDETSEETTQAADEQVEEPDAGSADMAKNRSAFGLPFPPKVTSVDGGGDTVRVVTTMSLDELAEFYKSRLLDYEIVRPAQRISVLGLRSYMPEIHGRRFAGTVRLFYSQNRPSAEAGDDEGAAEKGQSGDTQSKTARASRQTKRLYKREKGEPVLDRTADGELLAPGAKWGEPYTPPPGTPLHKERFRSNWGKPYGTWIAQ